MAVAAYEASEGANRHYMDLLDSHEYLQTQIINYGGASADRYVAQKYQFKFFYNSMKIMSIGFFYFCSSSLRVMAMMSDTRDPNLNDVSIEAAMSSVKSLTLEDECNRLQFQAQNS